MDAFPPYPVPTLRVIKDGLRMSDGYGFVDLFPNSPKRRLILAPPDLDERIVAPPPAVAFFPADGTSQFPYVRMRIDLPDGHVALADVSLQSFIDAADDLRRQLMSIGNIIPIPLKTTTSSSQPLGG